MASPLELLTRDETRIEPYLSKIWAPVMCGSIAFITACAVNFGTRRPIFSGIQKHVVWTLLAAAGGKYVDNYRDGYLAEKDAVLRHYVELHSEDFPTPERKKYADLFESWIPVR